MRIVGLQEFLKMPGDTLFSKYETYVFGPLCIKEDSISDIDFFYVQLSDAIDAGDSAELFNELDNAVKTGTSLKIDLHVWSRDGMFDKEQLFAIWELEDIKSLSFRIDECVRKLAPPQACA